MRSSGSLDNLRRVPGSEPLFDPEMLGEDDIRIVEHIGSSGRHLFGCQLVKAADLLFGLAWIQKVRQQVIDRDSGPQDLRTSTSIVDQALCHGSVPSSVQKQAPHQTL